MTLKFYYDIVSQPCRAIYIFLKVNDIPFEKKIVNLGKVHHRTEEFSKINPLQLVPVIDDDGFIVRESVGILRYLCREKNVPDHWYPKQSKAQAKVDEFVEWQHLGLRLPLAMFFRVNYLYPLLTGKDPLQSDIDKYKNLMSNACDLMEKTWLDGNKKFLIGDHLTIADLLAAMEIEQPRACGYDPRHGRPKLTKYMSCIQTEMSPYYDEACQLLYKISQRNQK